MLDARLNKNETSLTVLLSGRLDTMTSSELDGKLNAQIGGVTELTFDLQGLEYISSAGLRILLSAQKTMNRQGSMVIRHVSDEVREIFDVTGFSDIMTIE